MGTALLLCEDCRSDPVIQAFQQDYDIRHVVRQRDALAFLRSHLPDLLLLDLDMRDVDPYLITEEVRSRDPAGSVIMLGISRRKQDIPDDLYLRLSGVI